MEPEVRPDAVESGVFDRLRARVQQLQASGVYAIVELFDGNQLTSARCSTDGYAFTGATT